MRHGLHVFEDIRAVLASHVQYVHCFTHFACRDPIPEHATHAGADRSELAPLEHLASQLKARPNVEDERVRFLAVTARCTAAEELARGDGDRFGVGLCIEWLALVLVFVVVVQCFGLESAQRLRDFRAFFCRASPNCS